MLDSVGTICPECYVQQDDGTRDDDYGDERPGWREQYYDRYGYTPVSVGFSDDDYAAIEDESGSGPTDDEAAVLDTWEAAGLADDAADNLDHYLES